MSILELLVLPPINICDVSNFSSCLNISCPSELCRSFSKIKHNFRKHISQRNITALSIPWGINAARRTSFTWRSQNYDSRRRAFPASLEHLSLSKNGASYRPSASMHTDFCCRQCNRDETRSETSICHRLHAKLRKRLSIIAFAIGSLEAGI